MKPYFELRRTRDFGEIISDTFTFLKENFKELFLPMLIICSVFIVVDVIAFVFMLQNAVDGANSLSNGSYNPNVFEIPGWSVNAIVSGIIYYFSYLFYNLSIFIITYSYIAIYMDKANGEKPTLTEVWGYYRYYFLRVLGSSIVCSMLIMVGMLFCLLPGIYFATVLSLVLPIIIFENASFGYSFNKSFSLIKGNWWLTFGTLVVLFIVLAVASLIIGIPSAIIQRGQMLINPDAWVWPAYSVFMLLNNIFLMGYAIFAIALSMCYFSYTEQKEGTGLMDRINMIGQDNNDAPNLSKEEF